MTSSLKTSTLKTSEGQGFAEQTVAPYVAGGPARAITLVPEHQRWVDQAVAEGRFETADDAVTFALDHFLPIEPEGDDDWMIPLIEEARADVRLGNFISADEMRAELDDLIARLQKV